MPRPITAVVIVGLMGMVVWSMVRLADSAADIRSQGVPVGTLPVIGDLYDPVLAGEPLPDGFRQLIRRDGIAPIYEPAYVGPDEVDWPDDTLVVGVAIEGDARAYPVNVLNRREMVIDRLAGVPVLVTW